MPELPEVETVRRGLEPVMVGARIEKAVLNRADLRFPFPPRFGERLTGRKILSLSRRAKYIVAQLDSGEALILHLGMSGRFLIMQPQDPQRDDEQQRQSTADFTHEAGRLPAHDHVVLHLNSGFSIIYNDTRRFGFMDLVPGETWARAKHFAAMGIEPLGNELSGETLARLFDKKTTSLKAALLDQRLIAGLGNIYVCEALFRAGLSPEAPAGSIVKANGEPSMAAKRLAIIIRDVLEEAIVAGGSTLRDFAHADGSLGYFQHRFKVYGREGESCVTPACKGVVLRKVQSGRSTFFCPECQKLQQRYS